MKKYVWLLIPFLTLMFVPSAVNAAPLDSLRESYMYYMMDSCVDFSNSGVCDVLNSESSPITDKTFRQVLDILEPTNPNFLDVVSYSYRGSIIEEWDSVYLFPLRPTVYNSAYSVGIVDIKYYNFFVGDMQNVACYVFDLGQTPNGNELGHATLSYSSDCFREPKNGERYSGLIHEYYYDGNKLNDFNIKVSNFDLDDIDGNRIASNTVKPDIDVPPEEIYSKDKSLLDNIVDFFINISKSIGSFFGSILDFGANFFTRLGKGAHDLIFEMIPDFVGSIARSIKELFIPADGFFKTQFDRVYQFFNNKLGFLFYPLDLTISTLQRFVSLSPEAPIFHIPDISVGDFGTLIHAVDFDLSQAVATKPWSDIYSIYLLVVNGIVGFALVNLAIKKEEELLKGGA